MKRQYVSNITPAEEEHLQALLDATKEPQRYRHAMRALGHDLGERVKPLLHTAELAIACTVEDADYLARGFLDAIEGLLPTHLTCFWNKRQTIGEHKLAPIIRRYQEPFDSAHVEQLVVLKSIISSGCVVKTNLIELLDRANPKEIFIVSPVLHSSSKGSLEAEFPQKIAERFKYIYLAEDFDKEGSMIRPGIGGSVYELLGVGDQDTKNKLWPALVQEREEALWRASKT